MKRATATERVLRHGKVLLADEGLVQRDIMIDGESIAEIDSGICYAGAEVIDASGWLVLPGIIDIHGDAFERNIMPRPKTMFPLDIAMLESDRQLAANGITTAYHGVTISWEPGLRCLAQSLDVIETLDAIEPQTLIDNRLHIRWENYAFEGAAHLPALFGRSKPPLLAFNDHTTKGLDRSRNPVKYQSSADKALISLEDYLALLDSMAERTTEVAETTAEVARLAQRQQIKMLSHDDVSPEMRDEFRTLGAHIAEFPLNWKTAESAAAAGDVIVLGAPNVVRGGSHNGAISAEDAIRRGLCHVLASDYYYPSLRHAAFKLVREGVLSLESAWGLVSALPAKAADLADRGILAAGKRADIVAVHEQSLQVVLTIAGGRPVFRSF